jgi:membrane-associated phospholipid phosphatase
MTLLYVFSAGPLWHVLTRLGEAEILLPAAVLTAMALFFRPHTRKLAIGWMLLLGAGAAITTASKVAFIGWGLGWAAINFTGISGHAMFASAIYPVLIVTCVATRTPRRRQWLLALGCGLALLVGVSRVVVGAHSMSEVVAGLLLGGALSATTLSYFESTSLVMRPLLPALLLAWVAVSPFQMQASQTHSLVTRLALTLSGHQAPFTRAELLRHLRQQST